MAKQIEFKQNKINGALILTANLDHIHSLALDINFWVGSFIEEKDQAGISHFLEHILFKGSKNYPNEQAVGAAVEKYGGIINAFTAFERTNFWIVAPKAYIKPTLPVLFDVVFQPEAIKNEKEVAKEKGVILEERKRYKDDPDSYVTELADQNLNPSHPVSRPIIGYSSTIKAITPQKLMDWWQRFYSPANAVIVVVGPKANQTVSQIKTLIPQKSDKPFFTTTPKYASPNKARFAVHYKKIKQVKMVWYFERVKPATLETLMSLRMLARALGQGLNSILFAEIRTKAGLSYDISAREQNFANFQLLDISGGFAPENIDKAIQKLSSIFSNLKKQGLSRKLFTHTKKGLLGELQMSLDNPQAIASFALEGLRLLKQPLAIEAIIKTVKALKLRHINRLIKELFQPRNCAITLLGPLKEKQFLIKSVQKLK